MNTGLKVWLWIVFVINIISGVMMIPLMLIQPLLIVSLIAEVLIIVGAGLILFAQKKVGFYLMIACAAIGLVINIFGGVGVVKSIISAVLCPLITYLFMQKDWDSFRQKCWKVLCFIGNIFIIVIDFRHQIRNNKCSCKNANHGA